MNKLKEGVKYDDSKTRWDLLPFDAVEEIVKVLMYGANKYDDHNWRKVDNAEDRYFSACIRHLTAHQAGELRDPESGLYHLAHAACCLIFMQWFALEKDRKYAEECKVITQLIKEILS